MISVRTKATLAAARAHGGKLGNPKGAQAFGKGGSKAAVASLKAKADAHARDIAPIVADIRAAGATTLVAIAAELNARKIKTARGGRCTRRRCAICSSGNEDRLASNRLTRRGNQILKIQFKCGTRLGKL